MLLISCEDKNEVEQQDNSYQGWKKYYKEGNFETYFYVNSVVVDVSNNILFSAFIRRNNFTIDSTWIFKINENNISSIDTTNLITGYKYYKLEKKDGTKEIKLNSDLMFVYDKNENSLFKWQINDLKNKRHSSRSQTDKKGNIWLATENYYGTLDGIHEFDGSVWTSFFVGNDFWGICFDQQGNLYTSTLPDFNKPGVIMRYDYSKWDTIFTCSGKDKWIPCMHFDSDNNLWFGVLWRMAVAPDSGDGLFKYDGKTITNYSIYNSSLPSNSVIDIAIDNKNNKWIATYSGGLIKLAYDNVWKVFDTTNAPMTYNSIEHVIIDNDQNIYLAVQGYGLMRFKE